MSWGCWEEPFGRELLASGDGYLVPDPAWVSDTDVTGAAHLDSELHDLSVITAQSIFWFKDADLRLMVLAKLHGHQSSLSPFLPLPTLQPLTLPSG